MYVDDRFVSRAWLAGIPFAGWALFAGLVGDDVPPVHPGFFLFVSVIALVGCFYGWTVSRPELTSVDLMRQMRLLALLLVGVTVVCVAVLWILGGAGSAILAAVCGLLVSAGCWPSDRAMRRRDRNLHRPYKGNYVALALITGVLASLLVAFSALDLLFLSPAPTEAYDVSQSVLLLALAISAFIQAWDERRRPRHTREQVSPPSGRLQ